MNILILGVSGMLGSAMLHYLSGAHEVMGTARDPSSTDHFSEQLSKKIISNVDVFNSSQLEQILKAFQPQVVINCIGIIKQVEGTEDPLITLPANAMFPHQLARTCEALGVRVIHISTDCVFSGDKGQYTEQDVSDARDLYGKSKFIGELSDYPHCITLRTSIIGHGVTSNKSLVDWFLAQVGTVEGYTNAIYSGLPTIELARIIDELILPDDTLEGLYHVSSKPISKFNLLKLIKDAYGSTTQIIPNNEIVIDRSLNCSQFTHATSYETKEWVALIDEMHKSR